MLATWVTGECAGGAGACYAPLLCRSPRLLLSRVSPSCMGKTMVRYFLIVVAALVAVYAVILLIGLIAAYEWLP
jgi:hypothetical protein